VLHLRKTQIIWVIEEKAQSKEGKTGQRLWAESAILQNVETRVGLQLETHKRMAIGPGTRCSVRLRRHAGT
jgi:hypothetical protein